MPQAIADIAVVITCYQPDPVFFREALASLEAQTIQPREVCVVDDGSPEPVELPPLRLPVSVVRQDNTGGSGARNRGVMSTSASIIHIFDQDELLEPDFYAGLLPAFDDPDVSVSYCAMRLVDSCGAPTERSVPGVGWPTPTDWLATLIDSNEIGSSAALFRRSLWTEVGAFTPYRYVQDWRFWLAAATRSKIAYCSRELAYHRRHPAQLTDASRELDMLIESIDMLADLPLPVRYRLRRARSRTRLRLAVAEKLPRRRGERLLLSAASLPLAPRSSLLVARRSLTFRHS